MEDTTGTSGMKERIRQREENETENQMTPRLQQELRSVSSISSSVTSLPAFVCNRLTRTGTPDAVCLCVQRHKLA